MKRKDIIKELDKHEKDPYHFTEERAYHKAEKIVDVVYTVLNNYGDAEDEMGDIEDLRDALNESADAATPVYHYERIQWLAEGQNFMAFDEIADELGSDGLGKSLMDGIGIAYCMTLEREAWDALQKVWDEAEKQWVSDNIPF